MGKRLCQWEHFNSTLKAGTLSPKINKTEINRENNSSFINFTKLLVNECFIELKIIHVKSKRGFQKLL